MIALIGFGVLGSIVLVAVLIAARLENQAAAGKDLDNGR